MLTRASLLVCACALAASAGGQPPAGRGAPPDAVPPDRLPAGPRLDTAFPNLTPPAPGARGGAPDLPLPPLPRVAADAPLLRRVQLERVREGLSYLYRVEELMRTGQFAPPLLEEYTRTAAEVYLVAAGLEDAAARRVPWYEVRVRRLKQAEEFVRARVETGAVPPHTLHLARLQRLGAEADLLQLQAEAEPAAAGSPPVVCAPVVPVPKLFRRR